MEERTGKIIRRSIYTFLKDFEYFTSTPAILLFPFSASILLLRSFYQSCSLTKLIVLQGTRISFLDHLNLPPDDQIMIFIILVFSLPFALSSLVMAKASIIQSLNHHKPIFSSLVRSSSDLSLICYKPQISIYLLSIVLVVTINTTTLLILFEASSFFRSGLILVLSSISNPLFNLAAGIVFYMVLTNTMVICNLALVVASIDNCPAYKAIQKACLLRKGKNSMALLLALPINLGLVAIEALFRYRVVRAYDHVFGKLSMSMVLEGLFIAYLFSLLIVLETITSYLFIKNCDSNFGRDQDQEQEQICIQIKLVKDDTGINF